MNDALGDLRYALRSLARRPLLSTAVLVAFGLGIGANSAVFSIVDGVLLRSLPYRDADRLAMVWDAHLSRGVDHSRMPPARFAALGGPNLPFQDAAACATAKLDLATGSEPMEIQVYRATPNFFGLLGIVMVRGRGFLQGEGQPGGDRVVVVSERLWRSRFGGDPSLVGRSLSLNGELREVVGIAPPGLEPFEDADAWIPLTPEGWQSRVARTLLVAVRLRGGISFAAAQRDLDLLARRLEREFPDTDAGRTFRLIPLHEEVVAGVRTGLWVLWGAVTCVLLVACANIAALLLSRGISRRREIAVRAALGASRTRLLLLVLTESLLLAAAGGALGLGLASLVSRLLVRWTPVALPRAGEIAVDGRALAFTVVLSALAGALAGVLPAAVSLRHNLSEILKESGERGGASRSQRRWLQGMVVGEVALSLVLLAGAGLLTKSLVGLLRVDLGLRPGHVLTFRVSPPRYRYPAGGDWARVYGEILAQLRQVPGVQSAGAVSQLPLGGGSSEFRFLIEGRPERATAELPTAEYRVITPSYFATVGIPLLEGEALAEAPDRHNAVLINRALAQRYFSDHSPVGQRISVDGPEGPWLTVAGVVGDVRHFGPGEKARPEIYISYARDPWPALTFTVRTGGDPLDRAAAIRASVSRVDPRLPLADLRSLDEIVADSIARPRFVTALLTIFAALALLLAAVGLYGTIAYSVSQRTREIGVRLSLGALPGDIATLVLAQASRLALAGAVLGLGAASLLTRLLQSLLFQVRFTDPTVFVGVAMFTLLVAIAAAALPARRASRVDPGTALRGLGELGSKRR